MDRTSGLLGQSLHRIMDLIGRGRLLDSGCSLGVFAKRQVAPTAPWVRSRTAVSRAKPTDVSLPPSGRVPGPFIVIPALLW